MNCATNTALVEELTRLWKNFSITGQEKKANRDKNHKATSERLHRFGVCSFFRESTSILRGLTP